MEEFRKLECLCVYQVKLQVGKKKWRVLSRGTMFHFPARDLPSGCHSATVSSAHRHTQGECIDLCSGWLRSATGNGDEQDELPVGGSSDRTGGGGGGGGVSDSYYDCYIGPSRSWRTCAL